MATIELVREESFRLGNLEVSPSTREIVSPGGRAVLEPRVMRVLVMLAHADGHVVGRDELAAACWEVTAVSEDAINRVISKLRQLSEGPARGAFVIETIAKVGYRLVPGVPSMTLSETADTVATPPSIGRPRRIWIAGAALATVAIAILAVAFIPGARREDRARPAATPASAGVDPVAYELYRRAVDSLRQRQEGAATQAIALLEQAISRAPRFSRAWSSLAFAQLGLSHRPALTGPLIGQDAYWERSALESAHRAIALDAHNGEPYGVLAFVAVAEQGDEAGLALYDKGIAIEPTNVYLIRSRGQEYLTFLGLTNDALIDFRRAHQLDPIDPRTFANLSSALIAAGHVAEARAVLNRGMELYPTYTHIWRQQLIARLSDGQFDAADAMLMPKAAVPDGWVDGLPQLRLFARAARTNDPADIEAAMRSIRDELEGSEPSRRIWFVWGMALLGRIDEAYALARPDTQFDYEMFVDSVFAPFRRDPRFVGLFRPHFAYWTKTGRWPNFCSDPTLPYDCKREVARLASR